MATDYSFTLPPSHGIGGVLGGAIQRAVTVTRPDPSRAEIAAMAMQGLLSNTDFATYAQQKFPGRTYQDVVAEAAVNCADALRAALEKPRP